MAASNAMKVCIYGAGAIGNWLGTALAQAGCSVSVVARGATLAAVRERGIELQSPVTGAPGATHSTFHAVEVAVDPATLGVQDLVIVAVKAPAMASVAARIAPLLGSQTIVMSAMNGLPWWFLNGFGGRFADRRLQAIDPDGRIAAGIAAHHVIGCVVHASCINAGPGVVRHVQGRGLIIGEPAGAALPRTQALADLLGGAGFEVKLSDGIQRDIWYKLWGNMTVNPLSAITGATTDLLLKDDDVRGFMSAVMLEAREIGARFGIPIAEQPEDRHAVTRKLGAFKSSMLQDVEAGRAIELDALVTAVRELGTLTGVPTPFTNALLGVTRVFAQLRGLYP